MSDEPAGVLLAPFDGDVAGSLLMRAAGGDLSSFAGFYDLTVDRAFALARVLCATAREAEDLIVRAYRAALQHAAEFPALGIGAPAWLLGRVFSLART